MVRPLLVIFCQVVNFSFYGNQCQAFYSKTMSDFLTSLFSESVLSLVLIVKSNVKPKGFLGCFFGVRGISDPVISLVI